MRVPSQTTSISLLSSHGLITIVLHGGSSKIIGSSSRALSYNESSLMGAVVQLESFFPNVFYTHIYHMNYHRKHAYQLIHQVWVQNHRDYHHLQL